MAGEVSNSGDVTRWGFLGAGQIAQTQSMVLPAAEGAELFAVASRDIERAQALGPPKAYGSYEELLADPEVDAVYIALPNDAHLPWAVAALEAGKAVLCEKPLGCSADEVEQMAQAAERTGGLLVEATWSRWHPRTQRAAALLAEGRIGPVRHISAGFTFSGVGHGNFRLDPAKGGGALYDVGCYAVGAALWAVGGQLPDEAVARSAYGPTGVDLTTEVILSWTGGPADGATAEIRAGMAERESQWLTITGDAGEIELPEQPFTASWTTPVELLVSGGRDTERIAIPGADPYKLMFEQVSSVLRGGPGWVQPIADSRAVAAVLDACFASAAAGAAPISPLRERSAT